MATSRKPKPKMKNIHEFVDYLAEHLGRVRCLKHLSRKDEYFVALDKRMGERWSSVINGRSPSREQREAALQERLNVASVYPKVEPALKELVTICHSLHAYAVALPLPTPSSGGWEVRSDLLHPDNVMKLITAAIDDLKTIKALDHDNAYFADLFDQAIEMARWTRTSLNPAPEDRAKVRMGEVTFERVSAEARDVLLVFCQSFHDFCELYADFPTQAPMVSMQLDSTLGSAAGTKGEDCGA